MPMCMDLSMGGGVAHVEEKHWIPLELDLQMVVSQPVWCWDPNSGPVKEQDSILTPQLSLPLLCWDFDSV